MLVDKVWDDISQKLLSNFITINTDPVLNHTIALFGNDLFKILI